MCRVSCTHYMKCHRPQFPFWHVALLHVLRRHVNTVIHLPRSLHVHFSVHMCTTVEQHL